LPDRAIGKTPLLERWLCGKRGKHLKFNRLRLFHGGKDDQKSVITARGATPAPEKRYVQKAIGAERSR